MDSGAATQANSTQEAWNSTCESWLAAQAALEKYYLSIFYGLEFVVGMLGNVAVSFGYLFCLERWTSSHIYLFNLCLSDLAFLCTLPVLMRGYAAGGWVPAGALCVGNRYALHANLYTSVLFLALVSMDRYLLLKHPFREHPLQTRRCALLLCLAVWALVTLELLPMLPVIRPGPADRGGGCGDYASSGEPAYSLAYSLCLTALGFLAPLAAMGCFYCKMAAFLARRGRRPAPAPAAAPAAINAAPTAINAPAAVHAAAAAAPSLRRPRRLVLLAVAIFSALFTPYHVMRNVRIASRLRTGPPRGCAAEAIHVLYTVTRPVAFLNSAVNPVFYFLLGDRFREMLLRKLRRLLKPFTRRGR